MIGEVVHLRLMWLSGYTADKFPRSSLRPFILSQDMTFVHVHSISNSHRTRRAEKTSPESDGSVRLVVTSRGGRYCWQIAMHMFGQLGKRQNSYAISIVLGVNR
jgi:hypothetical protein